MAKVTEKIHNDMADVIVSAIMAARRQYRAAFGFTLGRDGVAILDQARCRIESLAATHGEEAAPPAAGE